MPAAPHLLLINPNTSGHVMTPLARHALALAPPGAVLTAVAAPFGEPYIASEAAAVIAEQAVPAAWAAHRADTVAAPRADTTADTTADPRTAVATNAAAASKAVFTWPATTCWSLRPRRWPITAARSRR